MPTLKAKEKLAVTALADHLYPYLPGSPHPRANQSIGFGPAAAAVGLGNHWVGGSKKPAIANLLTKTLEHESGKFCILIESIVTTSFNYSQHTVTREKIEELNSLVKDVGFKIPSLWDQEFLRKLPSDKPMPVPTDLTAGIIKLKTEFLKLSMMPDTRARGYAFEKFLNDLFTLHGLAPRKPFKLEGEQIDGSVEFNSHTYLIEARWRAAQANHQDLLVLNGKVDGKATWSRGLFISFSGFTQDGLAAFRRNKATNLICLCGQDLYLILENKILLSEVLTEKARKAAEEGLAYTPVFELQRKLC